MAAILAEVFHNGAHSIMDNAPKIEKHVFLISLEAPGNHQQQPGADATFPQTRRQLPGVSNASKDAVYVDPLDGTLRWHAPYWARLSWHLEGVIPMLVVVLQELPEQAVYAAVAVALVGAHLLAYVYLDIRILDLVEAQFLSELGSVGSKIASLASGRMLV